MGITKQDSNILHFILLKPYLEYCRENLLSFKIQIYGKTNSSDVLNVIYSRNEFKNISVAFKLRKLVHQQIEL